MNINMIDGKGASLVYLFYIIKTEFCDKFFKNCFFGIVPGAAKIENC